MTCFDFPSNFTRSFLIRVPAVDEALLSVPGVLSPPATPRVLLGVGWARPSAMRCLVFPSIEPDDGFTRSACVPLSTNDDVPSISVPASPSNYVAALSRQRPSRVTSRPLRSYLAGGLPARSSIPTASTVFLLCRWFGSWGRFLRGVLPCQGPCRRAVVVSRAPMSLEVVTLSRQAHGSSLSRLSACSRNAITNFAQ